jgi:hypothetical protein
MGQPLLCPAPFVAVRVRFEVNPRTVRVAVFARDAVGNPSPSGTVAKARTHIGNIVFPELKHEMHPGALRKSFSSGEGP